MVKQKEEQSSYLTEPFMFLFKSLIFTVSWLKINSLTRALLQNIGKGLARGGVMRGPPCSPDARHAASRTNKRPAAGPARAGSAAVPQLNSSSRTEEGMKRRNQIRVSAWCSLNGARSVSRRQGRAEVTGIFIPPPRRAPTSRWQEFVCKFPPIERSEGDGEARAEMIA